RHLERVALNTSYPEVAARVREIVTSDELTGRCTLVVDATGVGAPVVDLLRAARLGCLLVPVLITGGDRAALSDGVWKVPKRDLITGVQVMLQQERLSIAGDVPEGKRLVEEMMNMRVRVSAAGNETFGAWREGAHDDLVLAVALAVWRAKG